MDFKMEMEEIVGQCWRSVGWVEGVGGGCVCRGRGGGYVEERRCQQWREGSGAKVRVDEGEGDGGETGEITLFRWRTDVRLLRLPRCLHNAA